MSGFQLLQEMSRINKKVSEAVVLRKLTPEQKKQIESDLKKFVKAIERHIKKQGYDARVSVSKSDFGDTISHIVTYTRTMPRDWYEKNRYGGIKTLQYELGKRRMHNFREKHKNWLERKDEIVVSVDFSHELSYEDW